MTKPPPSPSIQLRSIHCLFFTSLQDVDYLREAGAYLTEKHGLCNIGQWHSHHRINLFKPSAGDDNTVWSNMPNLGLDRYIVFIANIIDTDDVTINCFLFQMKNLRVKHGKIQDLDGNSPLRLNENILQKICRGAQSFNSITIFNEEKEHIRIEEARENLDPTNYTENGSNKQANKNQGKELVKIKSSQLPVTNTITMQRDIPNSYIGSTTSTVQPRSRIDYQFTSDVNQIIRQASDRINRSTGTNYDLKMKAEETRNVNFDSDNRQQSEYNPGSRNQRHTLQNIAVGSSQICPHTQAEDKVITRQPSTESLYDNVGINKPTEMDVDEARTINAQHETTTPDTPSGTLQSKKNVQVVCSNDEDDDIGILCRLFRNMKICG